MIVYLSGKLYHIILFLDIIIILADIDSACKSGIVYENRLRKIIQIRKCFSLERIIFSDIISIYVLNYNIRSTATDAVKNVLLQIGKCLFNIIDAFFAANKP